MQARSDKALEAIRNWIIDGSLPPGSALVETQLARRLGVSRVPVREALQRLGQQGLVELRPGQSALVARRSARDVIELLEMRAVLQGFAAALAAERRTDGDIEALAGIVTSGRRAVDEEDWHQAGLFNSMFQLEMARISGSNQIRSFIENSRFQLAWLNRYLAQKRGHDVWNVHSEVIEALKAQNATRAESLSRAHILATKDIFVADYLAGRIAS
ncbi:GntR family transcriptional regulator [Arthrobacter sp. GCM10027362]|uniref:GntR family transcriptional regulator n=1 Tax=Arthrobacter sp. GCM10027362 TaxID=3273379 RepID=UPI003637DAED